MLNPKFKVGAIVGALGVILTLGAFAGSAVNAAPVSVSATPTSIPLNGTTTVTATYTDDSPAGSAVLASTNAALGVFTAAAVTGANIDAQVITGIGTAVVTVAEDVDTLPELTTISATFQCATGATGSTNFALTQGGTTIASAIVNCGTPFDVVPTAIGSAIAIGGSSSISNRSNVEISPAPGSDNDARIDVRVLAGGSEINGAHVTFIVDAAAGGMITVGDGTSTLALSNIDTEAEATAAARGIQGVAEPVVESPTFATPAAIGSTSSGDTCDAGTAQAGAQSVIPWWGTPSTTVVTGSVEVSPSVAEANDGNPRQSDGLTGGWEPSTTGGSATSGGLISACFFASDNGFDQSAWAKPGRVTITIIADVPTATSIVSTVTITVVGPPATITVAASPTNQRCGEKHTITATVKDSIGQNVSDHSRVEMITNLGGVLAGTGAVISNASFTAPISNTIAETFSGVATAFLLTSESHSGPYEVVVTAGGANPGLGLGGNFSTAPISAQVTVTCTIGAGATPAPAATVRAPSTGQGNISAPNTGDAGLADSSSSWALFVIGGAAAFALAGVASLRFARR